MAHANAAAGAASAERGRSGLHVGSVGMLIGGVLAVIGSPMPWVITPAGSMSGMSGAGLWTLSAGFIAIAGALLPHRRIAIAHCLAAGAALAFIAGWQLLRFIQLSADTGAWGSLFPGVGLVMIAGGAVFLLRAGYRMIRA